jgi:hypothetical protein
MLTFDKKQIDSAGAFLVGGGEALLKLGKLFRNSVVLFDQLAEVPILNRNGFDRLDVLPNGLAQMRFRFTQQVHFTGSFAHSLLATVDPESLSEAGDEVAGRGHGMSVSRISAGFCSEDE